MMALSIIVAAAAASLSGSASVQAGYVELSRGADAEAIAILSDFGSLDAEHPARLINLGVAYARQGEIDRARNCFEAAYRSRDPVYLETAAGDWVDSRQLARQALAGLERGTFASPERIARN